MVDAPPVSHGVAAYGGRDIPDQHRITPCPEATAVGLRQRFLPTAIAPYKIPAPCKPRLLFFQEKPCRKHSRPLTRCCPSTGCNRLCAGSVPPSTWGVASSIPMARLFLRRIGPVVPLCRGHPVLSIRCGTVWWPTHFWSPSLLLGKKPRSMSATMASVPLVPPSWSTIFTWGAFLLACFPDVPKMPGHVRETRGGARGG